MEVQMQSFHYFFGLNLCATLLLYIDNCATNFPLLKEGQHCASLVYMVLTSMRSDEMFELISQTEGCNTRFISDPMIPQYMPCMPCMHRAPKRYDGEQQPLAVDQSSNIDLLTNAIKERFD